ncbi:FAD-dependent oxidoreductase [Streptomyces sp. NPDC059970]|uniref:FAD-dependent oxidoreductase n=1 Tax=Streptomyces sp. NPDC059970 TaxID=3347019 RepID=UPI0036C7F503
MDKGLYRDIAVAAAVLLYGALDHVMGLRHHEPMLNMLGELRKHRSSADVAIVGYGIVGSVVARLLAERGARVMLIEAGSPLAAVPGTHLRNLPACRSDRAFHYDLVRACLRPASVPRPGGLPLSPGVPPMPEGNGVNAAQRHRANLPAAPLTTVFGGMGALWNCVAPRLDPQLEQWPGIPDREWERLYGVAESLLGVSLEASQGSARQDFLLRQLAASGPAPARPAPLAAHRLGEQPSAVRWTGPAEIIADASADVRSRIEVLPCSAVRRLHLRGSRITNVDTVDLHTGSTRRVEADAFLVAAGGLRTPALLWTSEIGRDRGNEAPLGRYLHEHPLAYAQVALNPEALGSRTADAGPDPFVMIPVSDRRPIHSLLLCDGFDAAALEGRVDERLIVSLYWYTMAEPRRENRVVFSDVATDVLGLPQPTFEYTLSPAERDRQQDALEELRSVGSTLGSFLPGRPPQALSPGASMHVLGTTRMGLSDDGESVTNSYGAVWGFSNLYIGGTGLLPQGSAANPTLAACALAVRTAERMASS